MTTITSIILSVLMGMLHNVEAYTCINNMQCNPASLVINVYRIVKGAKKVVDAAKKAVDAKKAIDVAKNATEAYYKGKMAEDAFDAARSFLSDSKDASQEAVKVTNNPQPVKTNNVHNNIQKKSCNKQCRQRVENWRKGFMPDNDTKQDDNKTSQKRKQRKMNKKNRRRQIGQLSLPERENQDDRIRVVVMGEEDYLILY